MYGGYYIEWRDENGKIYGNRFEKISELKKFAKANGIDLKNANRFDN